MFFSVHHTHYLLFEDFGLQVYIAKIVLRTSIDLEAEVDMDIGKS